MAFDSMEAFKHNLQPFTNTKTDISTILIILESQPIHVFAKSFDASLSVEDFPSLLVLSPRFPRLTLIHLWPRLFQ